MQFKVSNANKLEGVINLPGDKSVTQRAMLLNSLANGKATISNHNTGSDALSMFNCLQNLGAIVAATKSQWYHPRSFQLQLRGPRSCGKLS